MPEIIKKITITILFVVATFSAQAHEDDYLVGLSAFRDGLYDLSVPSFEAYLAGDTAEHKKNYANYLLYKIYFSQKNYQEAYGNFSVVDGVKDRRFDKKQMVRDKMVMLTEIDCVKASSYLSQKADDTLINLYLDSSCEPDAASGSIIAEKAESISTKMKAVSKLSENQEIVAKLFDGIALEKLDPPSKRFFALYFYKKEDFDRFWKVREVYEDDDVVSLELDRYWNVGKKDEFIKSYELYKDKYKLAKANACRAIGVYRENKQEFDCDLVNECMDGYSVDFVKVKGACLVKKGEAEKVTAFVDSLKDSIFPGMCGYGEYIFHKDLYTGKGEGKFYSCEERYKIADVLVAKKKYQSLVNIFFKKEKDMDKYYAAKGLYGLGKNDAAAGIAAGIKDESLKAKLGGAE